MAFIWHMHQPYYKEPLKGEYLLPWVRLHGLKDYYEMAAILADFPCIHLTFNLVPSLLVQINDYIYGQAQDAHLRLTSTPAKNLTQEDKDIVLKTFFMGHAETMINPHLRYRELLDKRNRKESFGEQDLLDLQVWSNLAWFGRLFRKHDALIHSLISKGRDYTEEDKKKLLNKAKWILLKIIPEYKKLQDEGRIEISISPYYHPILPLLVDGACARREDPDIALPRNTLRAEEDAAEQIGQAAKFYKRHFGRSPRGMWPPEGAVSNEIVPLMTGEGFAWLASCEGILAKSLKKALTPKDLYRPYRLDIGGEGLSIVFRDRTLSDMIGFSYSKWNPADAVGDFVGRLHHIHDGLTGDEDHLVTIILDGENAWEYYQNDGYDFLSLLYDTLSKDEGIETVTVSQYLEDHHPTEVIRDLYPGSWINHNFRIWIGHREDNLAWDYLHEARRSLVEFEQEHKDNKRLKEGIKKAWQELYIAQGSDWFWWYGDDHTSREDEIFDRLFREHLVGIYRFIDQNPPKYLLRPIKKAGKINSSYSTMHRGNDVSLLPEVPAV